MAITNKLRAELIRNFNDRERRAVRDARLIAEDSSRVSKALQAIDPKLETAVLALVEFVEFQRAIRFDIKAIAGHAAEQDELTQAHASDMAQTATVALNLPAILKTETLGLEEIPAGADDYEIERIILGFNVKIDRWRLSHPNKALRVGLVMDGDE